MSCLGICRQTYCRRDDQAQSGDNKRREAMPEPTLAPGRLRPSVYVWKSLTFGLLLPVQLPHPLLALARIGPRPSVPSGKHRKGSPDSAPCLSDLVPVFDWTPEVGQTTSRT